MAHESNLELLVLKMLGTTPYSTQGEEYQLPKLPQLLSWGLKIAEVNKEGQFLHFLHNL
jgi:hypothetical protein